LAEDPDDCGCPSTDNCTLVGANWEVTEPVTVTVPETFAPACGLAIETTGGGAAFVRAAVTARDAFTLPHP